MCLLQVITAISPYRIRCHDKMANLCQACGHLGGVFCRVKLLEDFCICRVAAPSTSEHASKLACIPITFADCDTCVKRNTIRLALCCRVTYISVRPGLFFKVSWAPARRARKVLCALILCPAHVHSVTRWPKYDQACRVIMRPCKSSLIRNMCGSA